MSLFSNPDAAISRLITNVLINPLPVPVITSQSEPCVASTGNVYSTTPGMSFYEWQVSPGGRIIGSSTASSVTVKWDNGGAQWVSVNYTLPLTGCRAAIATVLPVQILVPAPVIESGPTSVCVGSTGNIYTTQEAGINYQWTVSGGTITEGAGTNSITVTWTSTGTNRSVSVNYSTSYGCFGEAPDTRIVDVKPLPVVTISSTASIVCAASSGNVYTTAIRFG